jgi:hypothetical protein
LAAIISKIMTSPHSISSKNILRTNKEGLIFIIVMPIFGLTISYLRDIRIESSLIIILIGFILLNCIPSIYSFIMFYSINKNTVLNIDKVNGKILIQDKQKTIEHEISDITHIDRVVSIYYKNKIDNRARWPAPWTGYGFVRLTFDNGEKYIITSLILDPFEFPLEINNTHYKLFPDVNTENINKQDKEEVIHEQKRQMIEFFKVRFDRLDEQGLKNKIKEKENLVDEAKIAIEQIIKERSTNKISE